MLSRFIKVLVVASLSATIFLFVVSFVPMLNLRWQEASAQMNIDIPYALSNELGVQIIPNYPKPNETVSINLTLYTDDLNSANITWYQNGKAVLDGKGETRYSFKTGPVGTETKIEIRIRLLSGISFSKTFTLVPAGVDMVWEADSYVPPFYRGKALHPKQGTLKVVAMPEFVKNGSRISPKNLIYQWSNDTLVYQSQSGYGKNSLILDGSILGKSERISVSVTDPVNNLVAEGFIEISPTDPEIVFYENNPYYGHIFDSAILDTFSLNADEVQILAAPYYFTKSDMDNLKYGWRLNNQSLPGLAGSRTAIFRKPEKEFGKSIILLQIENANHILQQADSGLTMNFEK